VRAAFFEGYQRITVRDTPRPDPASGEVRLKVRYCGICGSDLTCYKTGALAGPDVVLGHEISAVVDVDPAGEWAPGARVTVFPRGNGCGECVWCREGKYRYCLNPPDRHHGGGFAEYMTAPARDLIALPEEVDDRTAAAAEPLGVALRGVELAGPSPGDLAYVSGLGSIGLFAVSGLVAAGCRVTGSDPRQDRRDLGLELGCEAAFDPIADDPVAFTTALDPHGPRVAMECAGVPESLQQVFDACGHGGVVGILGIPLAPVFLLRMTLKEQRAFSIQGPTMESMRRALDLMRERPEVSKVITHTVPLEQADEAFSKLAAGDGGVKVLLEPEG
jgi:threonine dehydrogenase-like Zn-dependent dehydrogenase